MGDVAASDARFRGKHPPVDQASVPSSDDDADDGDDGEEDDGDGDGGGMTMNLVSGSFCVYYKCLFLHQLNLCSRDNFIFYTSNDS